MYIGYLGSRFLKYMHYVYRKLNMEITAMIDHDGITHDGPNKNTR
jgi:hypothetical protein